jgi:hypothetical protein
MLPETRPCRGRNHITHVTTDERLDVITVPGVDLALHQHDAEIPVEHDHGGIAHQAENRPRQPRRVVQSVELGECHQRHGHRQETASRSVMIRPSVMTCPLLDRIGANQVGLRSKQRSLGPLAARLCPHIRVPLQLGRVPWLRLL